YIVSVDYQVRAHKKSKQFLIEVGGDNHASEPTEDMSLTTSVNGYDIKLSHDGMLTSGTPERLVYSISRDAKPVPNLSPYLGAPMHIAVVQHNMRSFIHTHGEL